MAANLDPVVRETDAFAMHMEEDPLLRSTIVAVALFDGTPDWDVLVDRMERATRLACGASQTRTLISAGTCVAWPHRRRTPSRRSSTSPAPPG